MEMLVGSGLIGLVFCIILPVIYFFKSKASVAIGWFFLGSVVAGIGSFIGFADLTRQAAVEMNKAAKERSKEIDRKMQEINKEFRQQFGKPNN